MGGLLMKKHGHITHKVINMQIVEDRAVRQLRMLVNPRDEVDKKAAIDKLNYTYGEGRYAMSSTQTADGRVLISALEL